MDVELYGGIAAEFALGLKFALGWGGPTPGSGVGSSAGLLSPIALQGIICFPVNLHASISGGPAFLGVQLASSLLID